MNTAALIAVSLIAQTPAVERVGTYANLKTIALAAAPTGSRVAVSMENSKIRIMDPMNPNTQVSLEGHPQPVYGLAWHPNGQQIATGDETARIYIWDAKSGKKINEFLRTPQTHQRGIQAISFSPDGKTLISTGKDDTVILWDYAKGTVIRKINGNGVVFGSAHMPNSKSLMMATLTEGVHYRNWPGMTLKLLKGGHSGQGIADIQTNKAGTRSITAGKDGKPALWDTATGKVITHLTAHLDSVQKVAISPDGRLGASSANDRMVYLFDLQKRVRIATIKDQSAVGSPLAISADNRFLFSVTVDDTLQIHKINGYAVKPAAPARRRR